MVKSVEYEIYEFCFLLFFVSISFGEDNSDSEENLHLDEKSKILN